MGLTIAWTTSLLLISIILVAVRRGWLVDRAARLGWLAAGLILAGVCIGNVIATSNVMLTYEGGTHDCGDALSISHVTQNSDTTPLDGGGLACKRAGHNRVQRGRNIGLGLAAIAAPVLLTAAAMSMRRQRRDAATATS
jgi:hypothetical protein